MMERGIEKPVWRIPSPSGPGSTSDDATPPLGVQVNFILQNSLDNLHDSKAIISLFRGGVKNCFFYFQSKGGGGSQPIQKILIRKKLILSGEGGGSQFFD